MYFCCTYVRIFRVEQLENKLADLDEYENKNMQKQQAKLDVTLIDVNARNKKRNIEALEAIARERNAQEDAERAGQTKIKEKDPFKRKVTLVGHMHSLLRNSLPGEKLEIAAKS